MSLETQKTYLGKTQAIQLSELQSERLIFLARFASAFIYGVLSIIAFLLQKTDLQTLSIGLISIGLYCGINGFYFRELERKPSVGLSVYVLVFFDVTFITSIIWAHSFSQAALFHSALFSAYFVAMTFTALHYRAKLVFWGGALCAIQYSIFYFWYVSSVSGVAPESLSRYLIQMAILLIVSALSILISRNNFDTIQKVVLSEMRYQSLVHRLPEMLFTLDSRKNFLWSNMASYAILGIPSKAIKHRNIEDFIISSTPLKLEHGLRGTFELHDFEQNRKFVDCVIQVVNEPEGHAVYEGIMTDVTDRELAISQREEMVTRLFQYQKMESLGTLASGMAHDFNNILQTITDISSMVRKETGEEQTRKNMDLLGETLTDARFLVAELLALGQKTPLNYSSLDLRNFIPAIAMLYDEQLGNKYRTQLRIAEEPMIISGDGDYLKRVFQNLFGNARDAMSQGGTITIECYAQHTEGTAGNIIIRFSDTGTGISQNIADKVFDPFFTTKKPGKGTGLGLALVQRIIALHNGSVTVEKTNRKGTTFRIVLPEIEPSEIDNDTKWIHNNRISTGLLLLDDDAKIRDILKVFLRDMGYGIYEASNYVDAASELRRNKDDCRAVIMDWKLGDSDPHQVINDLRKIREDLVVIVVSGYPPEHKSIEKLMIRKWFTKPYDKNQLDIEIQRALFSLDKQSSDRDVAD